MKKLVLIKEKIGKKKALWIFVALFLAAGAFGVSQLGGGTGAKAAETDYEEQEVTARDITVQLTGSGTLSPANSYQVTTLVEGEILDSTFEEGDLVEKDQLLYTLDSSDVVSSIQQSENALAQSQRSYSLKQDSLSDLNVKASEGGTITSLTVEQGDTVQAGQTVATVRNNSIMTLSLDFSTQDVASFSLGQDATVTLDGSFETLSGSISKISGLTTQNASGMTVQSVSIDVKNPGGLDAGRVATAMIGGIAPTGSGTFAYKAEGSITAKTGGEVSTLYFKEGDTVEKDAVLLRLENKSLTNDVLNGQSSLSDAQLSVEKKYDQLDSYLISSPIAGTVIEKVYKTGDTISGGKTLCTIYDLSYLSMTLNVDELDVSKIAVGQEVAITAEAVEGKSFTGIVTKVNISGTTTNGATSYPVTIRIDETQGLLPGMNVEAEIIISASNDVLAVPVAAVARGNRVLVKGQSETSDKTGTSIKGGASAPEGYTYVQVTTGATDGDYIEITSGLSLGDIVGVKKTTTQDSIEEGFTMTPLPVGDMPSGAPSSGGGGGRLVGARG